MYVYFNVINMVWEIPHPISVCWAWFRLCVVDHSFGKSPLSVWNIYGVLFLHSFTLLWCFCPRTFFSNNGLDMLPWTILITALHSKLRIIYRSAWGLIIHPLYRICNHFVRAGSLLGFIFKVKIHLLPYQTQNISLQHRKTYSNKWVNQVNQ